MEHSELEPDPSYIYLMSLNDDETGCGLEDIVRRNINYQSIKAGKQMVHSMNSIYEISVNS